jgi:hypothetical protein
MLKRVSTILSIALFSTIYLQAQVGIGTTTPVSTLDVRGSISGAYKAFSSATTAAIADNQLVFTGVSAATLTLPDATTCTGRVYWVKNTSTNASVLTIATTASQKIDGLSTWTLPQTNKAVSLFSNGANWLLTTESLPGNGIDWIPGGNNVVSVQNLGTTSNFDLPVITNNVERLRVTAGGNIGVGTSTFNGTNPEKFVVDAGTTSSVNAIVGKGNINNYLQLNIQNNSNGVSASSDVVATADNGSETTNYIDMGINGSGNTSTVFGNADDAYLYNVGQNLLMGTATAGKSLVFMTGGNSQSTNERMRIDGSGNVGIGTTSPAQKFHVSGGNIRITNGGINADIMVGTTFGGITNATGMVYYEIAGAETHMFGGQIIPDGDNTWTCGSSARRWSAVYAANGTIQTSDFRLKKNIHDLPYGLAEVLKMNPVGYNWKDNTGGNKVGLIAQEVRKIIPEVVVGDETKENLGMNYAELVPVLVNAIKDLNKELDNLKKELNEFKKAKQ